MSTLSVGEIASRSGLSVSAIHFYERKGLIGSHRTSGNQRRFDRDVLRRIALIRAAQEIGIALSEVAAVLSGLPQSRTPSRDDWQVIATTWSGELDRRIALLERLRDNLTGCIGCGCLSMTHCALFNPADGLRPEQGGAAVLSVQANS
ncbi:MAG: redox-sensitive transcriptional activator SoxR [Allorhizobium sp.]